MRYQDLIEQGKRKWGNEFSEENLSERWIPAFNSGERIRVKFPWGEVKTGTVGVTTGWRPAFLLMRDSRSRSSADILDTSVVHSSEKVTRGIK